jgi:hypothetical protein
VNVTPPSWTSRYQPSGTATVNAAPGGEYGTKAWLSGMSPDGLTSAPPAAAPGGELAGGAAGGATEGVGPAAHAVNASTVATVSPPVRHARPSAGNLPGRLLMGRTLLTNYVNAMR